MAIDSAYKRWGATATRRMPWFRRFAQPLADGTIGTTDRKQVALVYPVTMSGTDVRQISLDLEAMSSPAFTGESLDSPSMTQEALTYPTETGESL